MTNDYVANMSWYDAKLCNGTSLLENFGTSLAWNVSWNIANVLEQPAC